MMIGSVVLFITLVILSAFFSGSEAGLFSLDSVKVRRIKSRGRPTDAIDYLLNKPGRLLGTVLVGNVFVNIAFTSAVTAACVTFFGKNGVAIAIFLSTLILLIFGEILPKIFAIQNAESTSFFVAPVLKIFSFIFSPFIYLLGKISDIFIAFFKINLKEETALTTEELKTVVELGRRYGVVGQGEQEMIRSILEFSQTQVSEIMTHRTDIVALDEEAPVEKCLTLIKESRHSKIPTYKNKLDNLTGVIYAKDVFLDDSGDLSRHKKPLVFVPATKKLSGLLQEFTKTKNKIAAVVDEYGGIDGIVTLEDILEEIFGEIYDEFEKKDVFFEKISDGKYRLSGHMAIYDLNEKLKLNIPDADFDTVAGFVLSVFGKIPQEGEKKTWKGMVFTVEKVSGRRVKAVILEK